MYKVFYQYIDYSVFERYMSEFGLDEKKPIRNFSKGMRRQLYIALALAVRPKYLLLDEAFDGLDPLARLAFKRAINRAVEEDGTTVLISSHSLRELEDFCDSYALIDKMTVASSGDISEHVGRFCKFQLAFVDEISETAFANMPAVSVEKTGRFVRIVLEGKAEEMKALLECLKPAVIEQMPMDFEEMFIHEVESKGYQAGGAK
jgi:ABC-2 type transport system ATP-binding protein